MNNLAIRQKMKESRFFNYEIAEKMGIAENSLSRWFRKPLTEAQQNAILQTIDELSKKQRLNS